VLSLSSNRCHLIVVISSEHEGKRCDKGLTESATDAVFQGAKFLDLDPDDVPYLSHRVVQGPEHSGGEPVSPGPRLEGASRCQCGDLLIHVC